MRHALAQLALNACALFRAHTVQACDGLLGRAQHRCLVAAIPIQGGGGSHQGAGQLEHGIQIRLSRDAELLRRRAINAKISPHQLAVEREQVASRALQRQGHIQVAERHLLFQQPAQLHLQRVALCRKPHVQIEKPVVHCLERQAEADRRRFLPGLSLHLRVSRHGANCHMFF